MTVDRTAFWRILGLAVRAGKVISGTDAVEMNLRRGKGFLLIMTEDMAENGAEKLKYLASQKNVPLVIAGNRHDLGHWTGKKNRVTALVADSGFADRLMELNSQSNDTEANL